MAGFFCYSVQIEAQIVKKMTFFSPLFAQIHYFSHTSPAKYLQKTLDMITTKFYLDTRNTKDDKPAPLKLAITKKGQTALFSLGIKIPAAQWDKKAEKIINHPNKLFLNSHIAKMKQDIDTVLLKLIDAGKTVRGSAAEIKHMILAELSPNQVNNQNKLFAYRFLAFARSKKESTRNIYMYTYSRMRAYMQDKLDDLSFEDITKEWLIGFERFLARTSPSQNARNIHFRNIRAVFNEAIDDEITTAYPFRRFKIRPVATAKRALSVEQLRTLFTMPVEEHVEKYRDAFKLIFYLIGINVVDLCRLTEVRDGRIEYHRAKTNRLYSIKVEPEAMEIIERYRGDRHLLDILDRYTNYRDYIHRLNMNLQRIGEVSIGKQGKKTITPLFPELTSYWARHSWATIAASLDIPKETIAAALGHGGHSVTDIYIDFDQRKIDEANRRVLDWVLHGNK